MQELKDRILKEGRVLPGNIIKVDGFLNHRIDTQLMGHIAEEFGKHFNMDEVTLLVSKEWFSSDEKVLIIDDFMANGEAMRGLCDIVNAAGATLVGIGCAVEKGFQGGGDRLRAAGYNLKSLAIIESAEPGNVVFRDDD